MSTARSEPDGSADRGGAGPADRGRGEDARVAAPPRDAGPPHDVRRDRLGLALIVVGILAIVWGVLHVLEAANGPGFGPTRFEDRRGYDQTKVDVHRSFPGGLLRAGAGLALALAGGRLRRRPEEEEAD